MTSSTLSGHQNEHSRILQRRKKLSLNHWRYRLLHWCFNVKADNNTPFSNNLPRCLYTHYCPLFHLTNLIAIFCPIILIVKVVIAMAKAFVHAFSQLKWSWPTTKDVVTDRSRKPTEIWFDEISPISCRYTQETFNGLTRTGIAAMLLSGKVS